MNIDKKPAKLMTIGKSHVTQKAHDATISNATNNISNGSKNHSVNGNHKSGAVTTTETKVFKTLEACYKNENEGGTMYQYFKAMNPPWGYRKFTERQRRKMRLVVNRRLGKTHLSIREGPGRKPVPYLDGNTAVNLANEAFGIDGWRSEIISLEQDFLDVTAGRTNCSYTCVMRISLVNGSFRDGVGCGDSANMPNKADAIDKAKKSACTDALKRALKQFGDGLGNSIEATTVVPEETKIIENDFEDWFDSYYDTKYANKDETRESEIEETKQTVDSLKNEVLTLREMISTLINLQTTNLSAEQLYREEKKEIAANNIADMLKGQTSQSKTIKEIIRADILKEGGMPREFLTRSAPVESSSSKQLLQLSESPSIKMEDETQAVGTELGIGVSVNNQSGIDSINVSLPNQKPSIKLEASKPSVMLLGSKK